MARVLRTAGLRRACLEHAPLLFARVCEPSDRELGELGEEIAARELVRSGLTILGRRVRTRFGEVDVVAREGRDLVAVEVKTCRFSPPPCPRGVDRERMLAWRWRADGRLGAKQRARLERAAVLLARERGLVARVDLVEVLLDRRRARFEPRVEHRRDVGRKQP